jgi:hypothetical protein
MQLFYLRIRDRNTTGGPIHESMRPADPSQPIVNPMHHDLGFSVLPCRSGSCPRMAPASQRRDFDWPSGSHARTHFDPLRHPVAIRASLAQTGHCCAHPKWSDVCFPDRAKQGSSHATSGVCHGLANHRLSARCTIARAQKVSPGALRCASMLRASPGCPSSATRQTHAFDPRKDLRRSGQQMRSTHPTGSRPNDTR